LPGVLVVHARQDHQRDLAARGCQATDFPAQFQPIHSRHPQVDDRYVGHFVLEQRERRLTAIDGAYLVTIQPQQLLQQLAAAGIVVDDKCKPGWIAHGTALANG
jgi:hypothetical protein